MLSKYKIKILENREKCESGRDTVKLVNNWIT